MGYELLIIQLVLMVVSVAISMANQPKSVAPQTPEAGKLETPTADEGSPITVAFGTIISKRSNVVWYGDSLVTEIETSSGSSGK